MDGWIYEHGTVWLTVEQYRREHAARGSAPQLLRLAESWPSWVRAARDHRPQRISRSDGDRAVAAR